MNAVVLVVVWLLASGRTTQTELLFDGTLLQCQLYGQLAALQARDHTPALAGATVRSLTCDATGSTNV